MMTILRHCYIKAYHMVFTIILVTIAVVSYTIYLNDKQNSIKKNPILATNDEIWEAFLDFSKREKKYDILKHGYLQHRVEEFDNSDKHEILQNLVPLFVITPTYPRSLQLPELLRVSQSLKVNSFKDFLIPFLL